MTHVATDSFMSPTVRDVLVIGTFTILILTVGYSLLKRIIHLRHYWRPFSVDFGTAVYNRGYEATPKDNETFSGSGQIALDEEGQATFLLRVHPRIQKHPRRQPEFHFCIRLVSRSRNWRRLWVAKNNTEDGPRVDYIDGFESSGYPKWRANKWERKSYQVGMIAWGHLQCSEIVNCPNDALLRVGIHADCEWTGYLAFEGHFEVEGWEYSFTSDSVQKAIYAPISISKPITKSNPDKEDLLP